MRLVWLVRSLVAGRLYYEGGGSSRWNRRAVWHALRPYPIMTSARLRRWLWRDLDCGCTRSLLTRRTVLFSSGCDHWRSGLTLTSH